MLVLQHRELVCIIKGVNILANLPKSSELDQELDSLLVGPIPTGVNKFVFEADPPNISRIPDTEILGVTVILLTCSYDEREFVRVGYYVNNEYSDEALVNEPPAKPIVEKVRRNILAEKPRVTRFNIKWDSEESAPAEFPPEQPDVDAQEDDGATYGAEEEEEEEEEAAELAEAEATAQTKSEDADMEGVDAPAKADDEDDDDEAGSEDIEDESEDDDEEDLEEDEGEAGAGGDHDMEVDDNAASSSNAQHGQESKASHSHQHTSDVMVH